MARRDAALGEADIFETVCFWKDLLVGRCFFDRHSPSVAPNQTLKISTVFYEMGAHRFFPQSACADVAPLGTQNMDDATLARACKLVPLANAILMAAPHLILRHPSEFADALLDRRTCIFHIMEAMQAAA